MDQIVVNPGRRAEANYNQALANLQRATSTTLRANQVTVDVARP